MPISQVKEYILIKCSEIMYKKLNLLAKVVLMDAHPIIFKQIVKLVGIPQFF